MNIVFDIGGTNMRIAAAEGTGLKEIRKMPTPHDPQEGVSLFKKIVSELASIPIGAVAGGIAADRIQNGILSGATNLPTWNGFNLENAFREAFHVPVAIVNDTIAAALGEKEEGAGRGFSAVAYITVSTGVGGTCIRDSLDASPVLRDIQSKVGDLESQISGTAVRKKFGIEPKELNSLEERNALADILANALTIIAHEWEPDVFVLGGSMIVGVNPIPLERVREHFYRIPIRMAELGDHCGLVGGAVLAERFHHTH